MKHILWLMVFCIPLCCAVTVVDVKKLKVNNFFAEWSKFLDQVLQAQQDPIAPENDQTYQAFVQQAKTLNIPKVTGNKESVTAMQEQMKSVEKRIKDEKQIVQDWKQFSESVMNAQQPLSVENQEAYKELIKRAKDVGIGKAQLDAMEAKMTELKNKLGLAIPAQPVPPAPIIPPSMPSQESMPVPPPAPTIVSGSMPSQESMPMSVLPAPPIAEPGSIPSQESVPVPAAPPAPEIKK